MIGYVLTPKAHHALNQENTMETIELSICQDCMYAVEGYICCVNDENCEHIQAIENEISDNPGSRIVNNGGEDAEPHFSWHRCDLCHTDLGGDRYDATMIIPTNKKEN